MSRLTIEIENIFACSLENLMMAERTVQDALRMRRQRITKRFRSENPILGWTIVRNGEKGAYKGFSTNLTEMVDSTDYEIDLQVCKVYNPELRKMLQDEDNPTVFFDYRLNTATGEMDEEALMLELY